MSPVPIFLCATLLAEVGDIKRFSTFNKLYAYTGLFPKRFQTGKYTSKDKISKEGSRMLRQSFYTHMATILKWNPAWKHIYTIKRAKLLEKRGIDCSKVAIGCIIKRVLKAIYYCTKNEVDFDPNKAFSGIQLPKEMIEKTEAKKSAA